MFRAPFLVKIAESPHGWLHRSRTSSCKMTSSATNSIWSLAWPRGQFVYAWRSLSIPKMGCEFSLICARYQRRVISSERKKIWTTRQSSIAIAIFERRTHLGEVERRFFSKSRRIWSESQYALGEQHTFSQIYSSMIY